MSPFREIAVLTPHSQNRQNPHIARESGTQRPGGAGALVQAAAEGEAHLLSLRQLNLRVGNARPRAGTPFRSKAM